MNKQLLSIVGLTIFGAILSACMENSRLGFKSLSFTRDGENGAPEAPTEVVMVVPVDTDGDGTVDTVDTDDDNDGTVDTVDTDDNGDGTDDAVTPPVTEVTATVNKESWAISGTPLVERAVINIVADTSGSMEDNFASFSEAIGELGDELATDGFQVCFGIMGGYGTASKAGRLLEYGGDSCYCTDEYSAANLKEKVKNALLNIPGDNLGNSELQDFATYYALTNADAMAYNEQVSGGKCAGDIGTFFIAAGDEASVREAAPCLSTSPGYSNYPYGFGGTAGAPRSVDFSVNGTSNDLEYGCSESEARAIAMSTWNSTSGKFETWFDSTDMKNAFTQYAGIVPYSYNYIGHVGTEPSDPYEELPLGHRDDVAALGGKIIDIEKAKTDQAGFVQELVTELGPKLKADLIYPKVFDVKYEVCSKIKFTVKADGTDISSNVSLIGAKRFQINDGKNQNISSLEISYVAKSDPTCPL